MNLVIQVIRWALTIVFFILMLGGFSEGGFKGVIIGLWFLTAFAYTCPPIHAQIKKQKAKQEQAELQKIKEDKAVIKDKLNHIRLIYLSPIEFITSQVDGWKETLSEIDNNIDLLENKGLKSRMITEYRKLRDDFSVINSDITPAYSARNSIKRIMGWIEDDTLIMTDPDEIQTCIYKHDDELEEYETVAEEAQQTIDGCFFEDKLNELDEQVDKYLDLEFEK